MQQQAAAVAATAVPLLMFFASCHFTPLIHFYVSSFFFRVNEKFSRFLTLALFQFLILFFNLFECY